MAADEGRREDIDRPRSPVPARGSPGPSLTVRAAGLDWVLQIECEADGEKTYAALAAWLGPWATPSVGAPPRPGGSRRRGSGEVGGVAGVVTVAVLGPEERRSDPGLRATSGDPPGGGDSGNGTRRDAVRSPSFRRTAEGLRFVSDEYDVSVSSVSSASAASAEDGRESAAVRCVRGFEVIAVRAALRVLVTRRVVADGGVALHASSVKTGRGLVVFAGPSGAGKTTAAEAFPEEARLDPDLVLLAESPRPDGPGGGGGRWARLDHFDEYEPTRFAPGDAAGEPLRAVLLPRAGPAFDVRFLRGAEAVAACLHVPPALSTRLDGEAAPPRGAPAGDVLQAMSRVERLVRAVPVARLTWSLADDLPVLLDGALP